VPENVSIAPRGGAEDNALAYAEEIIPFTNDREIAAALSEAGYTGEDATGMADAIARIMNAKSLKAGTVLRLCLEIRGDRARIVRTSVYDRTQHLVTIALDDDDRFVAT